MTASVSLRMGSGEDASTSDYFSQARKADRTYADGERRPGRRAGAPREGCGSFLAGGPDHLRDAGEEEQDGVYLRPFEHQVAGHRFEEGKQGSLVDGAGRFYKPLQQGQRGKKELAFYQAVRAQMSVTEEGDADAAFLRSFVPGFFGTVNLEVDSGAQPLHLVLADVTLPYRRPSIMDVKVGHRTWYEGASPEYIERCKRKDDASTSSALGFKVCGLQVFNGEPPRGARAGAGGDGYWRPGKKWSKKLNVEQVREVISDFCGFGRRIAMGAGRRNAVVDGVLGQVRSIRSWFENQRWMHFYSASLLVLYEGLEADGDGGPADPNVKIFIIDFAHTFRPKSKEHDANFLEGLRCLEQELTALRAQ